MILSFLLSELALHHGEKGRVHETAVEALVESFQRQGQEKRLLLSQEHLKKDRQSHIGEEKNLLVFLGLDSLVSYLGGKAVEHKAGNFALSTLTLFKTIANTILGSVSNSSTIDRILLEQTIFSRNG